MKKLTWLLLLLFANNSFAAIALIQKKANASEAGGTSITVTLDQAMTVGATGIVTVYWGDKTKTITTPTSGGTWQISAAKYDETDDSFAHTEFVLPSIASAATTVVINVASGSSAFLNAHYSEWSGLDTTTQPDATASSGTSQYPVTGGTDAVVCNNTTPVTNGALLIGATAKTFGGSGITLTAGTGFTALSQQAEVPGRTMDEYMIQTTAAAENATFTPSGGSGMEYMCRTTAYRPAAGGGAVTNAGRASLLGVGK